MNRGVKFLIPAFKPTVHEKMESIKNELLQYRIQSEESKSTNYNPRAGDQNAMSLIIVMQRFQYYQIIPELYEEVCLHKRGIWLQLLHD